LECKGSKLWETPHVGSTWEIKLLQVDLVKYLPRIVKGRIHDRWMRWLDIGEVGGTDVLKTVLKTCDEFIAQAGLVLVLLL
jgi:hypothetical protein